MHANTSARPNVRRVALIAIDRLDPDAMCFALNACRRVNARLDVLTNLPVEEADRAVIEMRSRVDTPWRIIRIVGESGEEIFRYARDETGLLFLTSSADDDKACRIRDSSGSDGLRPGISWVIVESKPISGEPGQ